MTHKVSISLNDKGQWVCDPDPIKVRSRNVNMSFALLTPGYSFASANAIKVHNGGEEFGPSITTSQTTAEMRNKNTAKARFKYDVNLVRDSDMQPVVIDPTIDNEPR
jgi:hypothetical protein